MFLKKSDEKNKDRERFDASKVEDFHQTKIRTIKDLTVVGVSFNEYL